MNKKNSPRLMSDPNYSKEVIKRIENDLEKMKKYKQNEYDTNDMITLLESLIVSNEMSGNYLEAAKLMEECSRIARDIKMAMIFLVNAYKVYKSLSMKQQADKCYINGFKHFFSNSQPYYKYIFFKLLKNSTLSTLQHFNSSTL